MKIDFCTGIRVGIVRLFEMNSSTGTGIMNSAPVASAPAKKRVAKKTEDAPVAAPAPVPVVAAPAATETKKAAKKVAAAPVAPVAPVVAAPVATDAAAAAPEAPATTLDEDMKSVLTRLSGLREVVSTMITEVKKLEKRVHREIKDARKRRRRVKAEGEEGAKRGPSIFEIPTKVTDELCTFLGKPKGTLISRSNVTREINEYVKKHSLKNKHDIKPDAALKKLLRLSDADHLTYFNLQRYLNAHYIKEPKVVPTA
jgi:chromatin remodeling complex protein RSC6